MKPIQFYGYWYYGYCITLVQGEKKEGEQQQHGQNGILALIGRGSGILVKYFIHNFIVLGLLCG